MKWPPPAIMTYSQCPDAAKAGGALHRPSVVLEYKRGSVPGAAAVFILAGPSFPSVVPSQPRRSLNTRSIIVSGSYGRGDLDPGWIICPRAGVRQGAAGRPDTSLECLRQSVPKKFRLNLEKTEIHPTHYFDALTGFAFLSPPPHFHFVIFFVTLICVFNFPVFAKPKAHLGGGRGGGGGVICLSSRQAAEFPAL